nr:immunoglobulin light chain junction region [Macaca mulatta]MOV94698.1 immunoglobulin light chain junction region [Macaca mulatta]MOV94740.1 immunoglobulin light chain junction region [Macaca mulatta]MOV95078.1 immunoglobulin light chain junction region [Macaca mulatta]MOV95519.1 immunoglobulin light chain junction region [Macaca mulatta]
DYFCCSYTTRSTFVF